MLTAVHGICIYCTFMLDGAAPGGMWNLGSTIYFSEEIEGTKRKLADVAMEAVAKYFETSSNID